MPKVGFSISEDLYKVLESIARGRGISVHQLVKEIVELHALKLTSQVNLASLPENDTQVNLGKLTSDNARLTSQVNLSKLTSENSKLTSQVNLTKLTSDSVRLTSAKLTSANESQGQASNELDKRFEALEQRLRRLEDLVNAYTGKTDQVLQRFSLLIEAIESLSEKLNRVVEVFSKQQVLERAEEKPSEESGKRQKKEGRREKTTVCEILDRQLVLFESEIADKIRNRDAFFSAIEGRCGGTVIEGLKERIAVEKGYWQQFLEKLSKIDTSDDEKIKKSLDSLEYKLFKALKESALIIFDATAKKWIFAEKQKTGSSGVDAGTTPPSASTTNSTAGGATATSSSTKAGTSQRKKHYKKRYGEEDKSWLLQYVDNVA